MNSAAGEAIEVHVVPGLRGFYKEAVEQTLHESLTVEHRVCAVCVEAPSVWLVVNDLFHSRVGVAIGMCNACFHNPGRRIYLMANDKGWMRLKKEEPEVVDGPDATCLYSEERVGPRTLPQVREAYYVLWSTIPEMKFWGRGVAEMLQVANEGRLRTMYKVLWAIVADKLEKT